MKTADLMEQAAAALEVKGSTITRVLRLIGKQDPADESHQDVQHPFAIVTAFESDAPFSANTKRLQQMRQMLDRAGVKTYRLTGDWIEAPTGEAHDDSEERDKLVRVPEEALFCTPKDDLDFVAFESAVIHQASRFNQQAVVLSDGVSAWIRYKDGHLSELGDHLNVDSIQRAYQQMRGQKAHQFEFT